MDPTQPMNPIQFGFFLLTLPLQLLAQAMNGMALTPMALPPATPTLFPTTPGAGTYDNDEDITITYNADMMPSHIKIKRHAIRG